MSNEYDLQANGNNGVVQQTNVKALSGFTGASVWYVEATAVNGTDAVHGFTAGGSTGVYGKNAEGGFGVWGVASSFSVTGPGISQTGVYGVGDKVGIYGQSRPAEDQKPTNLPPPDPGTGVYGIGDLVGVEGDNDATGNKVGTGVIGESTQGIGVWGSGIGDGFTGISPYIGLYGQSQTAKTSPYPVIQQYVGTGVFGIGDFRGGVFQTTPHLGAAQETYANVQLTPLKLPQQGKVGSFTPTHIPPRLPTKGKPGDILAVDVQLGTGDDPNGMQLWVCIKEPGGGLGTTWARIGFDAIVVTR